MVCDLDRLPVTHEPRPRRPEALPLTTAARGAGEPSSGVDEAGIRNAPLLTR